MSGIKADTKIKRDAVFNTTVNAEIFNEFKARCKEEGYPMNVIFEIFMEQFNSGEFVLKFTKGKKKELEFIEEERNDER